MRETAKDALAAENSGHFIRMSTPSKAVGTSPRSGRQRGKARSPCASAHCAAEKSYLPDDLKFSRHVGVGLSTEQMGENPAITERLEADLNKVVEERGVDSDELRELGTNTFDVVLMANTIDFLENPREVLR